MGKDAGIESVKATVPPESEILGSNAVGAEYPHPMDLFKVFQDAAVSAGQIEPTAMAVASVRVRPATDGAVSVEPSCRVVLMRGYDRGGFLFYTNGESDKCADFRSCAQVAATFWWDRLGRQVRVKGTVAPATQAESDQYWARRHPGHRRGAWASDQSRPIASRDDLLLKLADVQARFPDDSQIPRPPHWHGWRITPTSIEFWQQRANRAHDRLLYTRTSGDAAGPPTDAAWQITRLQP